MKDSPITRQAMADAISGSCLETYLEPSVDFKEHRLIVHTAMSIGACIEHKMGFSDDRLGTKKDFNILNFNKK